MTRIQILLTALMLGGSAAFANGIGDIVIENTQARRVDSTLRLTADVNLDAVKLGSNKQFYLTPILEDAKGNSEVLPSLLVNGHAMHIAYERKSLSGNAAHNHVVGEEARRY